MKLHNQKKQLKRWISYIYRGVNGSKPKYYRRRKRKKINLTLILLTLLCGIFIGWILGKQQIVAVSANSNLHQMERDKYFTSLQIEEGDTIWKIAQENITEEYDDIYEYIDEIKECNQLSSDNITAGQYLLIPYYSENPRENQDF